MSGVVNETSFETTLGQRALGEFLGMTTTIFLGESIIANELLPSTKGHEMGWGFVALGFAFAFWAGIIMFKFLSAHINPAMLIALLCLGKLKGGVGEFFALFGAELAGAFCGAVLVWLHYLPHFKTMPEPVPYDSDEATLTARDYYSQKALKLASYNDKPERMVVRRKQPIQQALHDVAYYLQDKQAECKYFVSTDKQGTPVETTPEVMLDDYFKKDRPTWKLERRSVQVADLHRKLEDKHLERVVYTRFPHLDNSRGSHDHANGDDIGDEIPATEQREESLIVDFKQHVVEVHDPHPSRRATSDVGPVGPTSPHASAADDQTRNGSANGSGIRKRTKRVQFTEVKAVTKEKERVKTLYQKALIADQNAKLSIFATRPAIYSPVFNFVSEFLGTVGLILGALLIDGAAVYSKDPSAYEMLVPFWDAWFIFLLILGLGGPTGYAVNPARDFGPRMAHFLLPITNKGSSEFVYSWIPFVAPLCGGCAAAGLFAAIKAGYPPLVTTS